MCPTHDNRSATRPEVGQVNIGHRLPERDRQRERETERETDRQIDRQTDRQRQGVGVGGGSDVPNSR